MLESPDLHRAHAADCIELGVFFESSDIYQPCKRSQSQSSVVADDKTVWTALQTAQISKQESGAKHGFVLRRRWWGHEPPWR